MSLKEQRQFCAVCAWRENCAKKFCVPDGGAHCPDFTRDVTLMGKTLGTDVGKHFDEHSGEGR